MTHAELERELEEKGRELLRQLYQDHLTLRGDGEVRGPVIDAKGEERTHLRLQGRAIETIFGEVTVERAGYGGRGMESLHPLDAELNLPQEKFSLEVRRRAAIEAGRGSFDEAVEAMARGTGADIAKRQLEELVVRAAQDFDDFYTSREAVPLAPSPDSLLVLTVDGKGIVMRKEALREGTRKAAETERHHYEKRLARGEKANRKRMATVAALYDIAPFVRTAASVMAGAHLAEASAPRPRPQGKRVWASVEKEMEDVVAQLFEEALRRDPARARKWVVLLDGNEHQLKLVKKYARKHKVKPTIVLDLVHVLERLWKAAHCFFPEGARQLEQWVSQRLERLLEGKASDVAAGIRRAATRRGMSVGFRRAADECADYILNYKKLLKYDRYLAQGMPIGTGVIEGACRHLVKDRMDLTGARWGLAGAEAVLRLRSLRSSGDFDEYWRFHENEERLRNHACLYADATPPATAKGGQLRVIK